MKKALQAGFIYLLLAVACVGYTKPETNLIEPRLVGEWQTEPSLSQLGMIVTYYHFKKDGTFVGSVTFKSADLPEHKVAGTYKVKGNQLILTGPNKETTSTFSFEGDILVLDEGRSKVFRLKRK